MNLNKLKELQREIAKKVIKKDKFILNNIKTIAGFDLAYFKDNVICVAIVLNYKTLDLIEKTYTISKVNMPYIPSFLMFREGPPIIETYKKLKNKPDIIMVEGHGTAHRLSSGLACYVGVSLNKPCIGVAKKLLLGRVINDKVFINNELRAIQLKTKSKSIYISIGNKISLETSLKIVKNCLKHNKLPKPLHLAHKYATKIRNDKLRNL